MEGNEISNKCKRYWIKGLKLIISPITRLRKILRKSNMRKIQLAIVVLTILLCVATVVSYYLSPYKHRENVSQTTTEMILKGTPMRHLPLGELYKDLNLPTNDEDMFERQRTEMFMIKTPGCKIPLWIVNYRKNIKSESGRKMRCGKRAVFLRRLNGLTVTALIKTYILQKYMKVKDSDFSCCYQFLFTKTLKKGNQKIIFSNCTKFESNSKITLQTDFINIKCFERIQDNNKTFLIYEDKYAFVKKLNISTPKTSKCEVKYNVIMIGMDTMSFYRTAQALPRTMSYFNNEFWVAYKGYHKIGDNNFPNLMAAITGKNSTNIEEKCSHKMDDCNSDMIWNAFKEAGYVTAYGEDNLQLPDTFSNDRIFRKAPTDHYMRPFFLKAEYKPKNSTLLCTGKISSGQQILNYALDFAQTYKKDSFFGFFWINSFSHNENSRPHETDKIIENFFYRLSYTGVLGTTFIIFFSDHGLRFGELRLKSEAYYDERLPMFFIWTPSLFKQHNPLAYKAVVINQFRLVTPYDFYNTLLDIKKISSCSNKTVDPPEGCPNCHSLFKYVSGNRTCEDVPIGDKWCSCHKLYPLPVQDTEGKKSVDAVVKYLQSKVTSIRTTKCWSCKTLSLDKIYRIHFYYHKDKISLFYVVAFSMTPGNMSYEATVLRKSFETEGNIVGPISTISGYKSLGACAVRDGDRSFCVCQKKKGC